MAQDWCLAHGVCGVAEAEALYKLVCKRKGLQPSAMNNSPMKKARHTPSLLISAISYLLYRSQIHRPRFTVVLPVGRCSLPLAACGSSSLRRGSPLGCARRRFSGTVPLQKYGELQFCPSSSKKSLNNFLLPALIYRVNHRREGARASREAVRLRRSRQIPASERAACTRGSAPRGSDEALTHVEEPRGSRLESCPEVDLPYKCNQRYAR